MSNFKDLTVWQRSRKFACSLYRATKPFPADERFGLTSQLRRAATSVVANIAEGNARDSRRDQARFYVVAAASSRETEALLILACDLEMIADEGLNAMLGELDEIQRMLKGLVRYCRSRNT